MEGIKDTVLSVIQGLEAKRQGFPNDAPETILKKVLTKKELGHIKVNYFKKGLLGLNVDSSAWLYQFNLHKEGLLSRIKTHTSVIKDIKFRIGDVK
ncbi:MAG: hypothetical protein V1650_00085 [Candidatus Omnitrophota bacterium]